MHDVGGFSSIVDRIRVPAWWKFMRRWAPKSLMRWMAERRMPKEIRKTHAVVWKEGVFFLVPKHQTQNCEVFEPIRIIPWLEKEVADHFTIPTERQTPGSLPTTIPSVLNAKEFFADPSNLLLRNATGGWLILSDICLSFDLGEIKDLSYELDNLPMRSADLAHAVRMGWLVVASQEEYAANTKEMQIRYEKWRAKMSLDADECGKVVTRVD